MSVHRLWRNRRLAVAARDAWAWLAGLPDDPAANLRRRVDAVLRRRPFDTYVAERRRRRRGRAVRIGLAVAGGVVGGLVFGLAQLVGALGLAGLGAAIGWVAVCFWALAAVGALQAWRQSRALARMQAAPGWRVVELADDLDAYLVEHAEQVRRGAPAERSAVVAELTHLVEGLEAVAAEAAEDAQAGLGGEVRTRHERLSRRLEDALAEQRARREIRGEER